MSRLSVFSSPLLLGFEQLERLLEQATKTGDAYPPYNIERFAGESGTPENLRISLAVAGFSRVDLEVSTIDNQLVVKGRQLDEAARDYLHQGIAARQFSRSFVLAHDMEVKSATLSNGLLSIDLCRIAPGHTVRMIEVKEI